MSWTLFRTSLNACAASPVQRWPVTGSQLSDFWRVFSSPCCPEKQCGGMESSSVHNISGAFSLANDLVEYIILIVLIRKTEI